MLPGILGTPGRIFTGIGAERAAGVRLHRILPVLELGLGGPWAGAGVLEPDLSLPVYYRHGAVSGLSLAGMPLVGERFRVAPRLPFWTGEPVFGAVVAGITLALLDPATGVGDRPALVGFVVLLPVTFAGWTDRTFSRLRGGPASATTAAT